MRSECEPIGALSDREEKQLNVFLPLAILSGIDERRYSSFRDRRTGAQWKRAAASEEGRPLFIVTSSRT